MDSFHYRGNQAESLINFVEISTWVAEGGHSSRYVAGEGVVEEVVSLGRALGFISDIKGTPDLALRSSIGSAETHYKVNGIHTSCFRACDYIRIIDIKGNGAMPGDLGAMIVIHHNCDIGITTPYLPRCLAYIFSEYLETPGNPPTECWVIPNHPFRQIKSGILFKFLPARWTKAGKGKRSFPDFGEGGAIKPNAIQFETTDCLTHKLN
jgi:hypothetical protein